MFRVLLISNEKELNALTICDTFFGSFDAKHDSFESLWQ